MAEYVEREATCEDCVHYGVCYHIEHYGREIETDEPCEKFINDADVVEVVRCKDCKHWGGVTFGYICRRFSGSYIRNETRECDFCSFGAKMDGKEGKR